MTVLMRVGGDGAMGVIGRHGPPNTHPTNPEPSPFENAELARSTRTVTETRTEKIKLNYSLYRDGSFQILV